MQSSHIDPRAALAPVLSKLLNLGSALRLLLHRSTLAENTFRLPNAKWQGFSQQFRRPRRMNWRGTKALRITCI
jgi:hypothetical protein